MTMDITLCAVAAVLLLTLTLPRPSFCQTNIRNCRKPGSDVISEHEVEKFCADEHFYFYGPIGTNRVFHSKDIEAAELDEMVYSSVLIVSLRVERVFSKRVSWNTCVDKPDFNTCGPEYCRLSSRKHFIDVDVQCMLVYPDVSSSGGGGYQDDADDSTTTTACITMFDRMYISSQCPFMDFHVGTEYIMFSSAIGLDAGTVNDISCDVINDVTFSRFVVAEAEFTSRLLQYCNVNRAKRPEKWAAQTADEEEGEEADVSVVTTDTESSGGGRCPAVTAAMQQNHSCSKARSVHTSRAPTSLYLSACVLCSSIIVIVSTL